MNVCCCFVDLTLAERFRGLARDAGWNCWINHRPEDLPQFLAGIGEPVDVMVVDNVDAAAVRNTRLRGRSPVFVFFNLDPAVTTPPAGWQMLSAHGGSDPIQQLNNIVSLARLSVDEMNPEQFEPVTGFAFEAAFRERTALLGPEFTLVCLCVLHGEQLYDSLDPLSKTDLLAALANEIKAKLPPDAIVGFDTAYRYYVALGSTERSTVDEAIGRLIRTDERLVHYKAGVARITFIAGAATKQADQDVLQAASASTAAAQRAHRAEPVQWASPGNSIAAQLPGALERDEFSIVVQPQWRAHDRRLTGAEALIRWQGMEVGKLTPDQFIPVAEHAGTMTRIGDWVLESVTRASRSWLETKLDPIFLSVNVSPVQFAGDAVSTRLRRLIDENWLDPTRLELEMNQTGLESLLADHRGQVFALKDMGIRLALDNLGVGSIDPAKLLRLPVDTLKLDRRLIAQLGKDPNADALVAKLVDLATTYRLRSVAVGVETEAQLSMLVNAGCSDVQGYLISEPMDLTSFQGLLARHFWDNAASTGT